MGYHIKLLLRTMVKMLQAQVYGYKMLKIKREPIQFISKLPLILLI